MSNLKEQANTAADLAGRALCGAAWLTVGALYYTHWAASKCVEKGKVIAEEYQAAKAQAAKAHMTEDEVTALKAQLAAAEARSVAAQGA